MARFIAKPAMCSRPQHLGPRMESWSMCMVADLWLPTALCSSTQSLSSVDMDIQSTASIILTPPSTASHGRSPLSFRLFTCLGLKKASSAFLYSETLPVLTPQTPTSSQMSVWLVTHGFFPRLSAFYLIFFFFFKKMSLYLHITSTFRPFPPSSALFFSTHLNFS